MRRAFLFLILSFHPWAYADMVEEKDFRFFPEEKSLQKGHIHIAVASLGPDELGEEFSFIKNLDVHKIGERKDSQFLIAKYVFQSPRGLDKFKKDAFFNKEGFSLLSKGNEILDFQKQDGNLYRIKIKKHLFIFTILADVNFTFLTREEFPPAILSAVQPRLPQVATIQYAQNFNKIFHQSLNLCTYGEFPLGPDQVPDKGKTLIICFGFTAMDLDWYKKTKWLVNIKKRFQTEMVEVAKNFTQLPSS